MRLHNSWPNEDELRILQEKENARARQYDEEPDSICDCGEVAWACRCNEIYEAEERRLGDEHDD